ncbi:MAG: DUF928 domain-containing protein [Cyanobacteriota bacterium]|nr:DUF928 domain-containing protein [Cyanobacteriota bacterium]
MAVVNTPLRKTLATVGLTSLLSLFLYSFSSLVKAQPSKVPKFQLSSQQQNLVKCGYRQKEITLKLSASLPQSEMPQDLGNRIEDIGPRCSSYEPPIGLTALVPDSTIGITLAEYPTFFFYLPDANLEGVKGEFTLENEKKEVIYYKTVLLKASDSIIRVELSDAPTLPPLEVGKSYNWAFSLVFDKFDRSDSKYVTGWIKRIEPNSELQQKLGTAPRQEQPAIYAKNGIWYEALASLAQLRCASPTDSTITSDWESLLQQVGLPEISKKPLAQCNQAKAF